MCGEGATERCYLDPDCAAPGYGCGANGDQLCRWCGFHWPGAEEAFFMCPGDEEPPTQVDTSVSVPGYCPSVCSTVETERCFYDPTCDDGVPGCNAGGKGTFCRSCGFADWKVCPDDKAVTDALEQQVSDAVSDAISSAAGDGGDTSGTTVQTEVEYVTTVPVTVDGGSGSDKDAALQTAAETLMCTTASTDDRCSVEVIVPSTATDTTQCSAHPECVMLGYEGECCPVGQEGAPCCGGQDLTINGRRRFLLARRRVQSVSLTTLIRRSSTAQLAPTQAATLNDPTQFASQLVAQPGMTSFDITASAPTTTLQVNAWVIVTGSVSVSVVESALSNAPVAGAIQSQWPNATIATLPANLAISTTTFQPTPLSSTADSSSSTAVYVGAAIGGAFAAIVLVLVALWAQRGTEPMMRSNDKVSMMRHDETEFKSQSSPQPNGRRSVQDMGNTEGRMSLQPNTLASTKL